MVEGMHQSIAATATPWPSEPERPHGAIAAAVYAAVRGVNGLLRSSVDATLGLLPATSQQRADSDSEIKMTAALNGAFGDHLEATNNPLATPMQLWVDGQALTLTSQSLAAQLPRASGQLVVLAHGLCLSELGWSRDGAADIGQQLKAELDCTTVYLRYNSGQHISTNGQQFAQLLADLCAAWPVPLESLSLLGHSMGGLVIRSACWYANQAQADWLHYLQRVVCLGTPHHGSPVAKAGHALHLLVQKIPYAKPLAIGRRRSAGIKDLQHGDLLDEDWQGHHPDTPRADTRRNVPLLKNVDYYFAAATLGRDEEDPLGHFLGDLLVRLDSAIGAHREDLRKLHIKPENCAVFHQKNHFDLLSDPRVHQQIIDWCRPRP